MTESRKPRVLRDSVRPDQIMVGDEVLCPACDGKGVIATTSLAPKAVLCRGCDGTGVQIAEAQ